MRKFVSLALILWVSTVANELHAQREPAVPTSVPECSKIASPPYQIELRICKRRHLCAQDGNPKQCEERQLSGAGEPSGAVADASSIPGQNAHLSEMPSVQRVMQNSRGRGARDAMARAAATFEILGFLVLRDANTRNQTAQQSAKRAEYLQAWESILGAEQAKNAPECYHNNNCESAFPACLQAYTYNPASVRAILDRYFSPAWQASYVVGKQGNMWKNALALPAGTPPFECRNLAGS